MTVRVGTAADVRLLADMGARTFFSAYADDMPHEALASYVATSFGADRQRAELADASTRFFIAEIDSVTVGYAFVRVLPDRALSLERLYLEPHAIGRGAGRALMDACIAEAARRFCSVLRLTVWTQNLRAIGFYRRCGFAQVGRVEFLLGSERQTDLVMERPIERRPAQAV